jgi:hypothetical protein
MMLKRGLRLLALLSVVLTTLWGRPVLAQQLPGLVPEEGVVSGRVGEGVNRQHQQIPPHQWRYPNFGVDPVVRTDRVYQAFPQDHAVFSEGMVVTLGWQPITEKTVTVKHYEIFLASDKGLRQQIREGADWPGKPTVAIFNPPEPATYFWQVWAVLTNGSTIPSVGRTFKVVP